MGNEISYEDMMIHIMNNLPQEYDTVVEVMERKLNDLVDLLTLRNLKNELLLKYNRIKKNIEMNEESENEEADKDTTLFGYTKQFKGRCYNCNKFGHKKEDCPKLKKIKRTQVESSEHVFTVEREVTRRVIVENLRTELRK